MSRSPMKMLSAGVGDILGKYNCLTDWKLSAMINGEYFCPTIEGIMRSAIDKTMEAAGKLTERRDEDIRTLTEGLVLSGVAMDFAGNSRPASGAEQIVLKRQVKVTYNKGKGDDGADMGSIAYSGTADDGTKYIFTAKPKETYVLDVQKKDKEEIGLKATWTDADGKTQTRNLTKSGDNWELDLTGIPETATIEVSGTFKNDLRTIQTGEKIENGSVTLYDKEVKKGDKPVFTVKPDANYSLKDITVTYKGYKSYDGMIAAGPGRAGRRAGGRRESDRHRFVREEDHRPVRREK